MGSSQSPSRDIVPLKEKELWHISAYPPEERKQVQIVEKKYRKL
jgi:hypothetical protein